MLVKIVVKSGWFLDLCGCDKTALEHILEVLSIHSELAGCKFFNVLDYYLITRKLNSPIDPQQTWNLRNFQL